MIRKIQKLIAFLLLIPFSNTTFCQKYIWDKEHKCKIYDMNFKDRNSITISGGICKNELLNGKAIVKIFEDTTLLASIDGEFENGYINGNAEYIWVNGNYFKGTVKKNVWIYGEQKRGIDLFKGEFDSTGRWSGFGKLIVDNKDIFEGYFSNGNLTINGTWYFKNGSKWVGYKELYSDDYIVGMYYESPSDEIGELKRLKRTNAFRSYYYYEVETLSTPDPFGALAKYLDDPNNRYRVRDWGVTNKISEITYPFLENNAGVSHIQNTPYLYFNHKIYHTSGVDNGKKERYDAERYIPIKKGTENKVSELIKSICHNIKTLNYTGFIEAVDNAYTFDGLVYYLNVTAASINNSGYLVNPILTSFYDDGIYFLPIKGVKDIYQFDIDRLPAWKARAKCTDYEFRSNLVKKAFEKGNDKDQAYIPWSRIKSFDYSDFDIANNGYWLTINGEFLNYKTKQKIGESQKVFIMADYAQVLKELLKRLKDRF